MDWFLAALRKYAVFSGRARRRELGWFLLMYLLIHTLLTLGDGINGTLNPRDGVGLASGLFGLAMLLPSLAVAVRRLHDTGRSAWWLLVGFVPVIGTLLLLVFALRAGDRGPNRYGADPKTLPLPP